MNIISAIAYCYMQVQTDKEISDNNKNIYFICNLVFLFLMASVSIYFLNIELNWLSSYINPHTLRVIPLIVSIAITLINSRISLISILLIELFSYFV